MRHRSHPAALLLPALSLLLAGSASRALDDDLVRRAEAAMQQSVSYLRENVAVGGGYGGAYSPDLKERWGETRINENQNWIQPPGSPSTGFAFLEAYRRTGEPYLLEAAKEVADGLVQTQLEVGGWDYVVDFSPQGERTWFYRRNRNSDDDALKSGRNRATFDDNTTQHAARFLVAMDQELDQQDAAIHEAAIAALDLVLDAQHESGGWAQRWPPAGRGYSDFFTYNDNTLRDLVRLMLFAHEVYGDERYLDAVHRAGRFILDTQLPEPHPVWAQQYDADLQPAWARRFEPIAASSAESAGVMSLLVELALATGDDRYLEPIAPAAAWYERVKLPEGGWARFYELKTNRPLYMTSDDRTTYWLTYDDGDLPDHYGFKGNYNPERTVQLAERIQEQGLQQYIASRGEPKPPSAAQKREAAERLEPRVREVLDAMDDQGRWLTTSGGYGAKPGKPMLFMSVFQRNLGTLAEYVSLARGE